MLRIFIALRAKSNDEVTMQTKKININDNTVIFFIVVRIFVLHVPKLIVFGVLPLVLVLRIISVKKYLWWLLSQFQ